MFIIGFASASHFPHYQHAWFYYKPVLNFMDCLFVSLCHVIDYINLFSSTEPWIRFQDKPTSHVIIRAGWIVLVFSFRFPKWGALISEMVFAGVCRAGDKPQGFFRLDRCSTFPQPPTLTIPQPRAIALTFSFPVIYSATSTCFAKAKQEGRCQKPIPSILKMH